MMVFPPDLLDPKPGIETLRTHNRLVVSAPPGLGKSTVFCAALAQTFGKTIVAEPRRIAATSLARYIAQLRGEPLGEWVGYHIRFNQQVSAQTKLLYVTTGVLLNMLRTPHNLLDLNAVVIDEFHERQLETDVLLSLLMRFQQTVRPDLKLVVMSATLNVPRIQAFLNSPVVDYGSAQLQEVQGGEIISNGRYQIHVRYIDSGDIGEALDFIEVYEQTRALPPGGVLIFQPGKAEIDACTEIVTQRWPNAYILPLHAQLTDEEQDRIYAPVPKDMRPVIIATNIVETSITPPPVIRYVVDSGLEKVMLYSPKTRSYHLALDFISQASATQRAGRAGRLQDGLVIRLWSKEKQYTLPPVRPPEILRVDLTRVVLLTKTMGIDNLYELPLLDLPRHEQIAQAESALRYIGAVDESGKITSLGQQIAELPLEPRFARAVLHAAKEGDVTGLLYTVAMDSAGSPFAYINKQDPEYFSLYQRRNAFAIRNSFLQSDALLNGFLLYTYRRDPSICDMLRMRKKVLEEGLNIFEQMRNILEESGIDVHDEPDLDSWEIARRALAYSHADLLFFRNGPLFRPVLINSEEDITGYLLDRFSVVTQLSHFPSYLITHRIRKVNTRFVPYLISSATVISYELFSAVLAPFFKPTCLYLNSLGQLEMVVKFADEVEHNLLVPDEEIPNALTRLIEGSCITHSPELQQLAEAGRASHHPNLQMLLKEALRDYTNNTPFPNLVHYIAAVTKQLEHERSQGHPRDLLSSMQRSHLPRHYSPF